MPAPTDEVGVQDLTSLSDAQLCRVWRASYPGIVDGSGDPAFDALVDARRRYLDELERRHPAGFAAWISSGARAGGDPEPYLRRHQRRPA